MQLTSIEYVPPFPNKLPSSFVELLHQHKVYDLFKYHDAKKTHWLQPTRNAFSKRVYLMSKIWEKAERNHGSNMAAKLPLAAEELDAQRNGIKLPKWHTHLKKNDPTTKKRKRN